MSRHKLVKNLDLDDELDDYDGGENYGYDGAGGEGLSFVCMREGRTLANILSAELSEEDQGLSPLIRPLPLRARPMSQPAVNVGGLETEADTQQNKCASVLSQSAKCSPQPLPK
jgi:hypothetical protein